MGIGQFLTTALSARRVAPLLLEALAND